MAEGTGRLDARRRSCSRCALRAVGAAPMPQMRLSCDVSGDQRGRWRPPHPAPWRVSPQCPPEAPGAGGHRDPHLARPPAQLHLVTARPRRRCLHRPEDGRPRRRGDHDALRPAGRRRRRAAAGLLEIPAILPIATKSTQKSRPASRRGASRAMSSAERLESVVFSRYLPSRRSSSRTRPRSMGSSPLLSSRM